MKYTHYLTLKYFDRLIYFFYYLKETKFNELRVFIRHAGSITGKSVLRIMVDIFLSVFKYNVSPKDYFCFRFFEKDDDERKKWAGTGFMYEYQLLMNPRGYRSILENKILFLKYFNKYVKRKYCSLREIKSDPGLAGQLLTLPAGRVVLKNSRGQIGAQVEVINATEFSPGSLIRYMKSKKYDLAEEYVIQHHALMELSPSGVNTVRVFTQFYKGNIDFLGARLRISVNSTVDNMAAGNLAAPVDMETGIVNGPGVYSDITKAEALFHPVTGYRIQGLIIPHWKAVVEMARDAALIIPENRSVGWDIAITENGPELIEGNHNWCKLLWQMPVGQGLKSELEKYL